MVTQSYSPIILGSPQYLVFDKEGKNIELNTDTSSINGAGKTGKLHVKE